MPLYTIKTAAQKIASADDYKRVLLEIRDKSMPDDYLPMLRAQCKSEGHAITATQIAELMQYKNFNAANLRYGTMARDIAERLGYEPPTRANGDPMWWTSLSFSDGHTDELTGHFRFVMRPELVVALTQMRWA
jgi:hypothetical protein